MLWPRILRALAAVLLTALAGGLLAATLVRCAPGFGIDERELDPRLSAESRRVLRAQYARQRQILPFYWHFLSGLLRGDLGVSQALGRPVAELLTDRLPITARTVFAGWAAGWWLGLALALLVAGFPSAGLDLAGDALSSFFLCLPSAVLALLLMFAGQADMRPTLAVAAAVSLVVFPRVFRYARGILAQVSPRSHVLMARAKGVARARLVLLHVLAPAAPSILALAGVSVSVALGAAIPIEVVTDSPGIGQLAWQAAMQRDLPLLLNISLGVTIVTVFSNALAEVAQALDRTGRRAA